MSTHTSIVARLIAIWLVVLVASPFTAPFKTWDLAASLAEMGTSDLLSDGKLSKDVAVHVPAYRAATLSLIGVVGGSTCPRNADGPRLPLAVLRI